MASLCQPHKSTPTCCPSPPWKGLGQQPWSMTQPHKAPRTFPSHGQGAGDHRSLAGRGTTASWGGLGRVMGTGGMERAEPRVPEAAEPRRRQLLKGGASIPPARCRERGAVRGRLAAGCPAQGPPR